MASEDGIRLLQPTREGWPASRWTWFATPDRRLLLASILLQLVIGLLLGHANDMRIFMATGYLAGTGENPYVPRDLMAVFHHVLFGTRSTIGYPPPWPLVLAGLYRGTYSLVHELLLYNLAIKLPIIAANVGLAYITAGVLQNLGSPAGVAKRAWTFLLFNPFLLYFTAAWGQIDGIVALLALAALLLLVMGRRDPAGVLLALAVCVKPVALPVALAALVYLATRSRPSALRFALVFLAGVVLFYAMPFLLPGWDPQPATRLWHKVWDMSGTLSYMTILRLVRDPFRLTGDWWLLGLAWIPALAAAGVYLLRRGIDDVDDLLRATTALILIFFLTRTWLSEPNVVLVLPCALLLALQGRLDRRALLALWVIPLLFTIAGWTPLQLLWVAFPGAMEEATAAVARYLQAVLWTRAALVVAWQVTGWSIVVSCIRRQPARQRTEQAFGSMDRDGHGKEMVTRWT